MESANGEALRLEVRWGCINKYDWVSMYILNANDSEYISSQRYMQYGLRSARHYSSGEILS